MTRFRHTHRRNALIYQGITTKMPAVPEGKVRCSSCFQPVSLTSAGQLRAHRDADGIDCPQRIHLTGERLDVVAPPVVLPPVSTPPARKPSTSPSRSRKNERKVVTGHCHTCDRRVSGERLYCGPCLAKRTR